MKAYKCDDCGAFFESHSPGWERRFPSLTKDWRCEFTVAPEPRGDALAEICPGCFKKLLRIFADGICDGVWPSCTV